MATPNLSTITTVTPGLLVSGQLPAGDTTIYTVPEGSAIKIAKFILTNSSDASVVVSVSIVLSGRPGRRVLSRRSISSDITFTLTQIEGMWLGAGDVISANAASGDAIDVTLSGLVFA